MSELEHRWFSHCISSCFNLGLTCLPQNVKGRSCSRLLGEKETLETAISDGGNKFYNTVLSPPSSVITWFSKLNLQEKYEKCISKHSKTPSRISPSCSLKTNFCWAWLRKTCGSMCEAKTLCYIFIHVFILGCAYGCVLNVKHNKPYGVFICFLVQLYSNK